MSSKHPLKEVQCVCILLLPSKHIFLTIFLSLIRSLHGQHIEREIELEAARTDRDSLMVVRTYSSYPHIISSFSPTLLLYFILLV